MTDFHLYHFIALVTIAIASWRLPEHWQLDGISLISTGFICFFSPAAAIILFISSAIVYSISCYRSKNSSWILLGIIYCVIQFLTIRYFQTNLSQDSDLAVPVLGIAYFTCRHIHYLIETYKSNIRPNLRQFWHYQSFLPAIVTGPITRYPEFIRELDRRRWDSVRASLAIERIVYGYAVVVIIGNYSIYHLIRQQILIYESNIIVYAWLKSLYSWTYLYAQFSGWSSVAVGFSLLIGIRIPENFNRPFLATNLIEFWQCWHISLSSWCKDYVFTPIVSTTRKPLIAIIAAMIAVGIWHELSIYYLLWGTYHAIGIALCRKFQQHASRFGTFTKSIIWKPIAWFLTFNYLVGGSPIISTIARWMNFHV
jgi:alginate O-acetyltransferase complex protein AlgI